MNLPGFTTSTSGTWSQRWVFGGARLVRLRAAVRRGSALWFDVGVDGRRDCARLTPTTTPPGGIGAEPTRVILIAPAVDEAIRQNDPSTGCPTNATRGYGFSIRFAWKALPADDVSAYQLVLRHADAYSPALNVRVGASSYRWTSCNSFVSASNLLGWRWHVTALAGDGQEVARSEPRPVKFLPCALPDGGWCFAP